MARISWGMEGEAMVIGDVGFVLMGWLIDWEWSID